MNKLVLCLSLSVGSSMAVGTPAVLERLATEPAEAVLPLPAVPAEVERWQGGAVAAQSLTFDDNYSSQVKVLIPMLNARGLRGTFFLVTHWVGNMLWGTSWDDWATVISEVPHEIASHSVMHLEYLNSMNVVQGLTGVGPAELAYEVGHSKSELRTKLELPDGLVFAYPYSLHNAAVRAETANHYLAARAVSEDTVDATPADFFAIGSYSWRQGHTWQDMVLATDTAIARGEWAVDMIHGCDGEGWSPPASADYQLYFDHIKAKADLGLLWVAPFGEVVRYIKERDTASVSVSADPQGVHTVSLTVSQALPPGPVHLTVSFPVPATWSAIAATNEAGQPVTATLTQRGGLPYALVAVLPEAPGQVAQVTVVGT